MPRDRRGDMGSAGGCLLPSQPSLLLLLVLVVALCMSACTRGRDGVVGSGVFNGSSGRGRERLFFASTSTWCSSDKSGNECAGSTTWVGCSTRVSSCGSVGMAAASSILS